MMNTLRSTIWIAVILLFTMCMCLFQGMSVKWGGTEYTLGIGILLLAAAYRFRASRMGTLLLRFILAALLTLIGFYWFPARGTVYCGLPVPDGYGDILVELARLRAGVTAIGGPETTALITFPSFHTISAVLLISVYN